MHLATFIQVTIFAILMGVPTLTLANQVFVPNSAQLLEACRMNCEPPRQCFADNNERTSYSCRALDAAQAPPPSETERSSSQCAPRADQLMQECRSNVESARRSCDEKQNAGLNSVSDTASQIALMMGQLSSASIQAACSKMANLTQAANAALAAYRLTCSSSIQACNATCGAAKNYIRETATCLSDDAAAGLMNNDMDLQNRTVEARMTAVDEEIGKCSGFQSNVQQANQAIQNYMATSANASQCEALNNGTGTPPPAFCEANPTFAGCNQAGPVDCSKPEHANTNKVCICAKNPLDPQCSTANKPGGGINAGAGSIDSSSRVANKTTGDGFGGGDIPGLPGIAQGRANSSGGGDAVDGQQGSGSPLSGSSGGGGGGGSVRGGAGGTPHTAATEGGGGGFYGGGGGGRRFAGAGSGGSEGAGGERYMGSGAQAAGTPSGPDLRRFLPGGQFDPRRGISGVSGPDGITGPHSNIWTKIQNRYQVMRPSLLP